MQLHITISGRVQGVFFRAEAQREAEKLGITGWVRNTDDGSVEILAEGEKAILESFLGWCKKGPERAEIRNIEVKQKDAEEEYGKFIILY